MQDLSSYIHYLLKTTNYPAELNKKINAKVKEINQNLDDKKTIHLLLELYSELNNENYIKIVHAKENTHLLEKINLKILEIIKNSLLEQFSPENAQQNKIEEEDSPSYLKVALFFFLMICGTIFATVEGVSIFQTILTVISQFVSPTHAIAIGAEILFAIVAISAFYLDEMMSIGKSLGISAWNINAIFDLYDLQSKKYKEIFSLQESFLIKEQSNNKDDLKYQKNTHKQLTESYQYLERKIIKLDQAQSKLSYIKTGSRYILRGIGAIICGTIAGIAAKSAANTILVAALGATVAAGPIGIALVIATVGICALTAAVFYIHYKANSASRDPLSNSTQQESTRKLMNRATTNTEKIARIETLLQSKKETVRLKKQDRIIKIQNLGKLPEPSQNSRWGYTLPKLSSHPNKVNFGDSATPNLTPRKDDNQANHYTP